LTAKKKISIIHQSLGNQGKRKWLSLLSSKTPIRSEKVLKFNRKALRNNGKVKNVKADPRLIGSDDSMIIKVGKPGSRERVEALAYQYEMITKNNKEVSPFAWEG